MRKLLILLALQACQTATAPTVVDPTIHAEWIIAQSRLTCLGTHNVEKVTPEQFSWEEIPGQFDCGFQSYKNGCYSPTLRLIQWNTQTPTVIRHEAGHAILHALGNPWWRCYEHGDYADESCPEKWAYPERAGC
jgi:hypothetical protein